MLFCLFRVAILFYPFRVDMLSCPFRVAILSCLIRVAISANEDHTTCGVRGTDGNNCVHAAAVPSSRG